MDDLDENLAELTARELNLYIETKGCQVRNLNEIYLQHIGYKTDGYYVEVGAHNGISWSNTYRLAHAGWHGLVFEPHPELHKSCVKTYLDFPKIKIEKCCIGNYTGETDLYLGGSLTTTSKEMVDIYKSLPWAQGAFKPDDEAKPIRSHMYLLDNMLEKNNWPIGFDVLVVDTEGTELDVLQGLSIPKWKPKLMILELCETHPDKVLRINTCAINELMEKNYYRKIYMDSVNSVFVLDE